VTTKLRLLAIEGALSATLSPAGNLSLAF
jgi:hypothetical protein